MVVVGRWGGGGGGGGVVVVVVCALFCLVLISLLFVLFWFKQFYSKTNNDVYKVSKA